MAPKAAEKEKNAALVASLSSSEQADLLAQALLREYMHRRGFFETLRAFDGECHRNERTISSRLMMKKLLCIPAMETHPLHLSSSHEVPTFMEQMCSYRLRKPHEGARQELREREEEKEETGRIAWLRAAEEAGREVVDHDEAELAELRAKVSQTKKRQEWAETHRREYDKLKAALAELEEAEAKGKLKKGEKDGKKVGKSAKHHRKNNLIDPAADDSGDEPPTARKKSRRKKHGEGVLAGEETKDRSKGALENPTLPMDELSTFAVSLEGKERRRRESKGPAPPSARGGCPPASTRRPFRCFRWDLARLMIIMTAGL
ncbi:unnamed protein product, partial [Phytomonas sp. Hart1]